ncbi:MAG TPA: response regulator transcription factor [Candidatus Limnocylindria bacterium]|nr:response regulator transcription factor [Candidatus Limnocylindria bacterium]
MVADRETTRAALIHVLEEDPELKVVGEASDLATAKALLAAANPQVVLVNLGLNGRDAPGLSFIRYAKATRPDVGILSLKRQVEEHLLRSTLDAGADACCLATTSESRLRSAIKAVAEGATWLDPEISRILLHPPVQPQASGRRVTDVAGEDDPHLSPRETEILRLVTEGYTNDEIATNLRCSEATVKTHLIHLFRKLDVHDRVSAAVRGLRRGIV